MNAARLIAAAALLARTADAATTDDYAFAWPLQTQGDSAAWQVELNPEVYAAVTRVDLRDIEVVNALGEAVPLSLRTAPPMLATSETQVVLPSFPLPAAAPALKGVKEDEFIRLHLERGADGRLRSLDAQTGSASPSGAARSANGAATNDHNEASDATAASINAQRDLILDASAQRDPLSSLQVLWDGAGESASAQFSVAASDDMQQWRTVVAGASVLHLEQDGNVLERHNIALDGMRAAYLRVRRLDDGKALRNFHIVGRVRVLGNSETAGIRWLQATSEGGEARYLSRAFAPADGKHTVAYRYRLPAPLAIDAIRITLADDNSLARLVAISHDGDKYDDAAAWTQRGSFIAFRLRQDGAVVDNDEFSVVSAVRSNEWRLESAMALEHAPALSVAYRPDRLVFLAQGSGPYRLVAGSARALRGEYPIDTALAPLRARLGKDWQPPLAALGTRTTLRGDEAFKPAPVAAPPRDWRSWLLWAVLVGAAAIVGGLALSLLRKPDDSKGP